ncbi:MAG: VOC family protein [Pseudomonadota bacterium]
MSEYTGLRAIRSLDFVIILCDDLAKMRDFYADLFDFEIEFETPGQNIGFRLGTLYFSLRPRGRTYDGEKTDKESASIQLSFRVPPADVDAAYETLKKKNIEVIEKPTNQDWHHRTLFFKDPENNILEIYADIHPDDSAATENELHKIVK